MRLGTPLYCGVLFSPGQLGPELGVLNEDHGNAAGLETLIFFSQAVERVVEHRVDLA